MSFGANQPTSPLPTQDNAALRGGEIVAAVPADPSAQGAVVRIPLTHGLFALVDEADLPLIAGPKWFAYGDKPSNTYAGRFNRGQWESMHNLILPPPSGLVVDHRNGKPLDNRRENLRAITDLENRHNLGGPRCTSSTGILNVQRLGKSYFRVALRIEGKVRYFGHYHTLNAAAIAAYDARRATWGPIAVERIPDPRLTREAVR